jgi:RNA recognition motif-containing protein
MKWQDVKDLFRDHVGEVAYVELFDDEKGKPRGCGILEFNSEDMAQKAIKKLNKYEVKGRKILVQEALEHERDKYGYIVKGTQHNGAEPGLRGFLRTSIGRSKQWLSSERSFCRRVV